MNQVTRSSERGGEQADGSRSEFSAGGKRIVVLADAFRKFGLTYTAVDPYHERSVYGATAIKGDQQRLQPQNVAPAPVAETNYRVVGAEEPQHTFAAPIMAYAENPLATQQQPVQAAVSEAPLSPEDEARRNLVGVYDTIDAQQAAEANPVGFDGVIQVQGQDPYQPAGV